MYGIVSLCGDDNDPADAQPTQKSTLEDFVFVQPLQNEIELLGRRMDRIELALNRILERLQLPGLGDEGKSVVASAEAKTTPPIVGAASGVVSVPIRPPKNEQEVGETKIPQDSAHETPKTQYSLATEAVDAVGTPDIQPRITFPRHTSGAYAYTSLDTSQSQIRILAVQDAANFNDTIIANLKTISLDDNNHFQGYTALSYCWGAPVMDGAIILSGHHFPVTASLELAWRHLRDKKMGYSHNGPAEVFYWIDQICINQADIDERGNTYNPAKYFLCFYQTTSVIKTWITTLVSVYAPLLTCKSNLSVKYLSCDEYTKKPLAYMFGSATKRTIALLQ